MSNPKTTITGYLLLVMAVLKLAVDALQGNFSLVGQDLPAVLAAAAGVGFIMGKDGGH